MPELRWGATTNPGLVRTENEDTYVAESMVFAVADGMGGHQAGEVASALAASIVRDRLGRGAASEDDAEAVVHEVNAAIHGAARANSAQSGMGTTLTALAVLKEQGHGSSKIDEQLVLLNVGDSRTYLFRNGRLNRVTVDHSYVQELVATGHITIEEARTHPRRNIVTRALGIEPTVRADIWTMPIVRGDRFVLCSDGLVDEVPDSDILDLVATVADPQALSEQLVATANRHGGRDNVTVVVVDVLEGQDPPDPTEEVTVDPAWAADIPDAAIWRDDTTGAAAVMDDEPAIVPKAALGTAAPPPIPPPAASFGTKPGTTTQPIPIVPPAAATSSIDAPSVEQPPGPTTLNPSLPASAATATSATTSISAPAAKPVGKAARKAQKAAVEAALKEERDASKKAVKAGRPRRRRFSVGLFMFIVMFAAIITVTFTLIAVHARSGYFLGFDGDTVVVYRGQPGGVLWFDPTIAQTTARKRQDLNPETIAVIEQHITYSSIEKAAALITELAPPDTTPTSIVVGTSTTVASTTVAPSASTLPGATTTTAPSGP